MSDRCTGHCCREFYLPNSPDELRFSYAQWLKRGYREEEPMRMGHGFFSHGLVKSGPGVIWDIHLIYPMVRYLGKRFPPEGLLVEHQGEGHWYTCIHFTPSPDGHGGDCGIYDFRPAMCRDYPYGGTCKYKGCTWDKVSEKKNPTPPEAAKTILEKVVETVAEACNKPLSESTTVEFEATSKPLVVHSVGEAEEIFVDQKVEP